MNRPRLGKAVLAILFLASVALNAETATGNTAASETPVPYGPAEFPDWQVDMRRAEIISFGALPFMTFFSSIYYDVYRYYDHGQDEAYLPWPFKKQDIAVPLSEAEQKNVFYASIGISLGVAVVDFAWRAISRRAAKGRRESEAAAKPETITIAPIPLETAGE